MAVPYTIRPATANDAETIRNMVRSAPLNPNAVDWRYFMVLEIVEDEKPVIASIAMIHPQDTIHELDSVVTRPEYRGRGYAPAVITAFLERSPRPVYLLAETDLIAFYERLGFRVFDPQDAPAVMREEAEYVNRWFGSYATYHIMGMTA
ncbi:MAG: GNAT family N-acetyltransferase [Anaerolinea sp.]|nr:GNAT family N-acetyltransferase [Anaerolinea sp.]